MNKHLRLSERNRVITALTQSSRILIIQTDLMVCVRCCVERVCGTLLLGAGVEWRCVDISVSYKSISRKGSGNECLFGSNDQSWSLICSRSSYSFIHNNIQTDLSVKSIISRIGVFVDHRAGTLSFYSVSDTMSLIHTVQTTFTQPLYPGFWVFWISETVLMNQNRLMRDSTHNALSCMIISNSEML